MAKEQFKTIKSRIAKRNLKGGYFLKMFISFFALQRTTLTKLIKN